MPIPRSLTPLVAALLDRPYTSKHASYDLRRLRRKRFIERVPGHNVYRVTPYGRAHATFLSKLAARAVVPTLTELDATGSPAGSRRSPIVTAWRRYEHELDDLVTRARLAA